MSPWVLICKRYHHDRKPWKEGILMNLDRRQLFLGLCLSLLWIRRFSGFLEVLHPIANVSEPLESSWLPVGFWNSRIAMIRKRFIAKGSGSQGSWSNEQHAVSLSSDTWSFMHSTATGGMMWSVPPDFWIMGFSSSGRTREIGGHLLYPHWEFTDTACTIPLPLTAFPRSQTAGQKTVLLVDMSSPLGLNNAIWKHKPPNPTRGIPRKVTKWFYFMFGKKDII